MNTTSLSKDEAIRRIELLGGEYDPDSSLDIWDQLFICETLIHSTPVDPTDEDVRTILRLRKEENERNVSVNGSVNDIGKRQGNVEETLRKKQAIAELTTYTYRTNPKKIESLLKTVFASEITKEGHWLYIAQHYNPKSINSVIRRMTKAHVEGWVTIKSPASYFTRILKEYHHIRKNREKK